MIAFIKMLKFKKICIDSSYKVRGTSSDFTIDPPETVQLDENMLCQIPEVSIPHSWYSIQRGLMIGCLLMLNILVFHLGQHGQELH